MKQYKQLATVIALSGPFLLGGCAVDGSVAGSGAGGGQQAVAAAPESPHALGMYHFAAGQFGLAVKHFRTAMKRSPNSVKSMNGLAAAYDRLGRFDLAEKFYQLALAEDPESTQTLNNLGYSYWLQGRYDLAYVYLDDAEKRDREDPVILANRERVSQALAAPAVPVQTAAAPKEVQDTGPEMPAQKMWVSRTSAAVQTLVTQPSVEFIDAVSESGLDPKIAYAPMPTRTLGSPREHLANPLLPASAMADLAAEDASVWPADQIASLPVDRPLEAAEPIADTVAMAAPLVPVQVAALDTDSLPVDAAGAVDSPLMPDQGDDAASESLSAVLQINPMIEVSNGAGRRHMAARMRQFLKDRDLNVQRITNAAHFAHMQSTIYYKEGWRVYAMGLAGLFPADVRLVAVRNQWMDIRMELGGDLLNFDAELISAQKSNRLGKAG